MKIAICAATFRRPAMLGELLAGINSLELTNVVDRELGVVIVDNDPLGTGRSTIEHHRSSFRFDLHYLVEPNRGIAHARNRAIVQALAAGAEYVAILDDDEVPRRDWLSQLLRIQAEYGADVVYGPVVPRFPAGTPSWIVRGKFFSRAASPTGTHLPMAATHNVLLSRRSLTMWHPPFDPKFGLAGVDDTHFFWRLRLAGVPLISAADAIVEETIPVARMTVPFLFRRAFNAGAGYVACQHDLETTKNWKPRRFLIASTRTFIGGLSAGPALLLGKHAVASSVQTLGLGLGMFAGLVGRRTDRYRKIEGA